MRNFLGFVIGVILFIASAASAAPPAQLPPGFGRYVMVLQVAGAGPNPLKHVVEPDIKKLGGTVVSQHENERVIDLPTAAAKQIRADVNVAFLQRVWMGEPLDTWDERTPAAVTPPSRMSSKTDTNLTWSTGAFAYDGSGNIKAMGADSYVYDTVGRIVQATLNGTTETYGYDSFGNVTQKTITGDPLSVPVPAIDSSSNRLANESYDVAGNVTTNGFKNTYAYDAVGMLTLNAAAQGLTRRMIYTADDERIGTQVDSSTRFWEVRDLNGTQVLRTFAEASPCWVWRQDFVYAEGRLVAGDSMFMGGQRHYSLDHLGTVRMVTNDAKLRYGRHDYYPFGREQTSSVQEDANFAGVMVRNDPMRFAGHERDFNITSYDNTNYLDYMHARFYDPNQGRFLSVDPIRGNSNDPGSWNRYSYALGNPMNLVDPNGMDECPPNTEGVTCFVVYAKDPASEFSPSIMQASADSASAATAYAYLALGGGGNRGRYQAQDGQRVDVIATLQYRAALGDELAMMGLRAAHVPVTTTPGAIKPTYDEFVAVSAVLGAVSVANAIRTKIFTPDQQALVQLAKEAARRGISMEEASNLLKWAMEYGMKWQNHTSAEMAAHWIGGPHILIGPINHIPVFF